MNPTKEFISSMVLAYTHEKNDSLKPTRTCTRLYLWLASYLFDCTRASFTKTSYVVGHLYLYLLYQLFVRSGWSFRDM